MLDKYNKFINNNIILEGGSSSNPEIIYWNKQMNEIKNDTWLDFSIDVYSRTDKIYYINFKTQKSEYNYYRVLLISTPGKDTYTLEDSSFFVKKFYTEFWKNAAEYIKNFKYKPKCLGDLSHVEASTKYNM
jgi:hypothetical protein